MNRWSIWVLEYAVALEFPDSLAVYGAHNRGTHRAPFSYMVLSDGVHTIMVDVGFGDTPAQRRIAEGTDVTGWRSPREVLGQIGLTPEDVTHVIVTHAHYDHFGNPGAFPNAVFYIQHRELDYWLQQLTLPLRLRTFVQPIDPRNLAACIDLAEEGRLQLMMGDMPDLFPGLSIRAAFDTHTPGSCYVVIETDDTPLVLAGDNVYNWANLEGQDGDGLLHPVGYVVGGNFTATLVLDEMLVISEERPRRVIPMHEDRLRQEYPSRTLDNGAMIVEVALADGEPSRLSG